ncbi:MAG: hypothetical protein ABSG57_07760 [Candidatus Bathyarchaeia archaeon]
MAIKKLAKARLNLIPVFPLHRRNILASSASEKEAVSATMTCLH